MSSRTAAGRKRLQTPHPKVPPFNEHSVNQPKTFASAELIPLPPPVHAISVQQHPRLDLSNEFSPSLPSFRFPHPQSNQAAQAVSTYGASSPYEDIPQFHRPLLRVNPHAMAYQTPSEPPFQPPIPNLASPAKTPLSYVPSLPFPPSHPPPSPTKYSGHPAASYYPSLSQPSSRRPNRHSPTSSDLPEYRSMYSAYEDHIAQSYLPQVGTKNLEQSWGYNQYYQYPPGSRTGPPPLPPVPLSPIKSESRFPYRASPGPQTSLNPPTSHVQEPPGGSAYSSSLSGSGTSASSGGGRRPPPPPPPSPNFVFPGSRSIARPKVSSKITNSQVKLISKSMSHPAKDSQENSHTLDISSDAQAASDTAPESPVQSNNPEVSPEEDSFRLTDDYKRKSAPKVPETLVFPTGRSRAHPKLSSGPRSSKNSNHSSLNRDVNQPGGHSRFIEVLFKKKKVKVPNITPVANSIASGSVASFEPATSEQAVSTGSSDSNHEPNGHRERTKRTKPKSGSYPLDPYNSVLLDNDRYTGELLSRLNPTGSPSFHDYGDNPPASVLDLGCGQGHWVLEAAVTWKEYDTHVTGYDMVDISRNLLPWATEQGVRDNIRFVKGNFLKQQLPFGNDAFDLVRMSCLSLCITSDSWGFILQEVCRVLMTGGRLELIDDQIFFPYGRVSSTMNTGSISIIGSVASRFDSVLSPAVTTFSIYGDAVDNPGLGSTIGHHSSEDDAFDLEHESTSSHGQMSRVRPEMLTLQPRASPTLIPEAWDRALDISEDLEALFEHMLLDDFDVHKDPSDFILPLMIRVFGQAREGRTMNLVLAPPDTTGSVEYCTSQRQQGLSHCPGLILWPSTFIPMDHTEVEIHASKHLRTLLSCKTFLTQHAMEISDDERVDEEFISEALWEYENFLQHRFNPPAQYRDDSLKEESETSSILSSIAESTTSDSREAMLEIQSDLRQRFAWLPERDRDAHSNTTSVTTPSPPVSPVSPISSRSPGDYRYLRSSFSSSTEAAPAPSNEITHVRTFRVYEAIKLDNYVLTYDAY